MTCLKLTDLGHFSPCSTGHGPPAEAPRPKEYRLSRKIRKIRTRRSWARVAESEKHMPSNFTVLQCITRKVASGCCWHIGQMLMFMILYGSYTILTILIHPTEPCMLIMHCSHIPHAENLHSAGLGRDPLDHPNGAGRGSGLFEAAVQKPTPPFPKHMLNSLRVCNDRTQ